MVVLDLIAVWDYVSGMPGAGRPEAIIGAAIGLYALMPFGWILVAVGSIVLYRAAKT